MGTSEGQEENPQGGMPKGTTLCDRMPIGGSVCNIAQETTDQVGG